MPAIWNKLDRTEHPTLETMRAFVNSPLWNRLCSYIEEQYQTNPMIEYSGCSFAPGWHVKYKKAGRSLCILYPMEGYFITLVVLGERERVEAELALPLLSEYLQQLYRETEEGMGQKWLMIHVTDETVLNDVKQCIALRRPVQKK